MLLHDVADAHRVRLARHDPAARRRDPHRHAGRRRPDGRRADGVASTIEGIGTLTNPVVRSARLTPVRRPLRAVADRRPCTSATSAPRCSTGRSPGTTAARSCSGSRTPTRPATPRSPTAACRRAALARPRLGRGPEVGGPYAPYRQCERFGDLPRASSRSCWRPATPTTATPPTTRSTAPRGPRAATRRPGYDNYDRELTDAQVGRVPRPRGARRCCGSGCPTAPSPSHDLVRGEITFERRQRAGLRPRPRPTAARSTRCVNPVDDALMGITHVLRGEDLLPSTPRQIALYAGADRSASAEADARGSVTCRS